MKPKQYKPKRTAWDCPHCDNCLHIYTDNKGKVERVSRAEATIRI